MEPGAAGVDPGGTGIRRTRSPPLCVDVNLIGMNFSSGRSRGESGRTPRWSSSWPAYRYSLRRIRTRGTIDARHPETGTVRRVTAAIRRSGTRPARRNQTCRPSSQPRSPSQGVPTCQAGRGPGGACPPQTHRHGNSRPRRNGGASATGVAVGSIFRGGLQPDSGSQQIWRGTSSGRPAGRSPHCTAGGGPRAVGRPADRDRAS